MGCQFLLGLVALLFMSGIASGMPTQTTMEATTPEEITPVNEGPVVIFQPGSGAVQMNDGDYKLIQLEQPFLYYGRAYTELYLSMDGYISFYPPNIDDEIPNPNLGKDVIAPLWTDLEVDESGKLLYEQDTNSTLVEDASAVMNSLLPGANITVSWIFLAFWIEVPLEYASGVVTIQVALISTTEGLSYVLVNYIVIPYIESTYWLAGIDMENREFDLIAVNSSTDLPLSTNINMPGLWVFDVSGPRIFYWIRDGITIDYFDLAGSTSPITFRQPFRFFGFDMDTIYLNKNGVLSFSKPLDEAIPTEDYSKVSYIIAPFWTDLAFYDRGKIAFQEVTMGPLLSSVTDDINNMFLGAYFKTEWLFIINWEMMSFADNSGNATFQAVLASDGADTSYVILNYGNIDYTDQYWQAGYKADDGNYYFIDEYSSSDLCLSSNVNISGRWAFKVGVPSSCEKMGCTMNEECKNVNGVLGCGCGDYSSTNYQDVYDAEETCSGSGGSLSLSRCLLFEAGYSAETLHLNDPSCKGDLNGDKLVFYFNSNDRMCGTTMKSNSSHIIFKNSVGTTDGMGVISHSDGMNIGFSCAYPVIQTISMPMAIEPIISVLSKELSKEGIYTISMIPYPDQQFLIPYSGTVTLEANQELYIAVNVDQFDGNQIAIVLDYCWATPVNNIMYDVSWDLIIDGCPNPNDGTVRVLQNGISTSGHFSFRMFTFTSLPGKIYLHCQVHLCLLEEGGCAKPCDGTPLTRRRRSDIDNLPISLEL